MERAVPCRGFWMPGSFGRSRSRSARPAEIEATYFHLVAFELLARAGCAPAFEPQVSGKTPDLSFTIGGQAFIGDVFVTHSPSASAEPLYEGSTDLIWVDSDEPRISRANASTTRKPSSMLGRPPKFRLGQRYTPQCRYSGLYVG